jgi:hypothetical protein
MVVNATKKEEGEINVLMTHGSYGTLLSTIDARSESE